MSVYCNSIIEAEDFRVRPSLEKSAMHSYRIQRRYINIKWLKSPPTSYL